LLRAWEGHHGVLLPRRSASGHRSYSEEDVRAVRWIREKADWGMGVRRAVELFKGAHRHQGRRPASKPLGTSFWTIFRPARKGRPPRCWRRPSRATG
jgi:hypothetical protein